MNILEIITWKGMPTKKTMTHCWSASSSVGLELWLHGGIKWGSRRQSFAVVGVEGGYWEPCFSICCCITNHPKLHALKQHNHWLFLTVLQLGSNHWGWFISAPHDSGWHCSTGARGSTILTHMSGTSAEVAVVGWVSLLLFTQPLNIQ